jgi:predicted NAD/FAD-binding protein
MTELQSLPTDAAYCVSLNMRDDITDENTLESFDFEHPLFSEAAVAAQKRHHEISGIDGIHYCGAYWRNGFHEDGVVSAIEATRKFGVTL